MNGDVSEVVVAECRYHESNVHARPMNTQQQN